ncbi:peptidoglycan-binding protein LysM [Planotetraspora thailandica]|uniref:Peptidoglycan-binding protein LysM n=1 Tax=Planotetraspora thailandica TaxID=487172 RepID=A0A8J3V3U6_9ACTN|nr:peptidoglycan-binding protein LysM [Planotetraspora thailandica]
MPAVLVFGTTTASQAAPKPTESQLKKQLASLGKQVDRLIADYNATRVELAKAKTAEKDARDRLASTEGDYETAQREVGHLAAAQYQTSNAIVMPDPSGSAVLAQLQAEQVALIERFSQIREDRRKAADAAKAMTAQLTAKSAKVAEQRADAQKLIGQIKNKLDALIPLAPGRLANGSWAPELPGGADNITPRMRLMKSEVEKHFSLRYTVGCYRAEDSGEHPLGRACDFMMSSGGAMPTADMKAMGDDVAAWAIKNGPKLGVMYVIWRQRIYNLGSPGWRTMEDRGGTTANHYDHVHISMY